MNGEELFDKGKFVPPPMFREQANVNDEKIYEEAERDLEAFWARAAEELAWYKKWDKVLEIKHPFYRWFVGGKLNASYNCVDRHLQSWRKNKAAILWEGEPGDSKTLTYQQLYTEVVKFANVLKSLGVKKGDRVTIYLPMIPELPISMLACARIGAIHSVVFGGFSAQALRERINDAESEVVITADGGYRRGKIVPLKQNTDEALTEAPSVRKVVVVKRTGHHIAMAKGRDLWWHELMEEAKLRCEPETMDSTDPLFILYTSGTTGKPKGVVHMTGGYLVGTYLTTKYVFDMKDEDIYWCTADIGWITGHSYIVYGPLANGATVVMYEGAPDYPQYDRFWEIVEKYKVTILYTAPTAIRAFIKWGEEWPQKHDLSSLRLLGTVGEPINPDVWLWYYRVIGRGRCPIVDTWWQTETGMILITPLPGISVLKPGSAQRPFPGVKADVVDDEGKPVPRGSAGNLVIRSPWPAMLGTLYKDTERYKKQYWSQVEGAYFTGDGARIDEEGYFWLLGRIDDVINVSGHRLGTMEVESALVSHEAVAEAAVVGIPHEIKGQGIAAYVVLKKEYKASTELENNLRTHVRKVIGPIATPDEIHFVDKLPKTRSGKIMRRIMRAIKTGKDIGDVSTLEEVAAIKEVEQK